MPNPTLTEAIDRLADGEDLTADSAAGVLREVMEGNASEAQAAALLIALRAKGETVEEITGLARTMRELATPVEVDGAELVDTAGTGWGGRSGGPGREPVAGRRPSTCPPRPPSWPRGRGAGLRSTATARPPAVAA